MLNNSATDFIEIIEFEEGNNLSFESYSCDGTFQEFFLQNFLSVCAYCVCTIAVQKNCT